MAMPTANIHWKRIIPKHRVYVRQTPKGGNSYFVAVLLDGTEAVVNWGGNDSYSAQEYLNKRVRATARKEARERKAKA